MVTLGKLSTTRILTIYSLGEEMMDEIGRISSMHRLNMK
jgi:hypothetical protein